MPAVTALVMMATAALAAATPAVGARLHPSASTRPPPPPPPDALPRQKQPAPGAELGAYEWDDTTWWPTPSAYEGTLTTLKALGVTTLYVDITEAVSLTRAHASALALFLSDLATLVEEADSDGFTVDAVGGDPAWATRDRSGPAQLLSAVASVVSGLPASALDGVQFDVEPWALPGWRRHRAAYAVDWLRFLQTTVTQWTSDGLTGRLGFTVPYWFDGDTGGVPRVSFGATTGYPFPLALGILAPLDHTVLNVMAYRNATAGPNGSEALFRGNVDAVEAVGSRTMLLAGQETGNVAPPEITFYGTGCARFEEAATQMADAFDGDAPYQGIAVDDVESLEALCPG